MGADVAAAPQLGPRAAISPYLLRALLSGAGNEASAASSRTANTMWPIVLLSHVKRGDDELQTA